jgi:outer membrane protein assembly factor BamB
VLAASVHAASLRFVREGVIVSGANLERATDFRADGRVVPAARLPGEQGWLLEWAWTARATVRVAWQGQPAGAVTATAPLRPAPWVRWAAAWPPAEWIRTGAADETTALAFAPDGERLAAGSQQGRIAILAARDGAIQWSLQRPGRVIKQVAFSGDGARLYVGEQGPEGRLAAYDLAQPAAAPLWTFDASQDLGSKGITDPKDPYGWVTQPGAYRVAVVGSDLVAAFSRSWDEGGQRRARSRLYRVDGATGAVRWAYPADGAQPGILTWFALDPAGQRVLLPLQSPRGASGAELRTSQVVLLDLGTGRAIAHADIAPVAPYPAAGLWRGLALQPGGSAVAATTEDGRAFLWQAGGGTLAPLHALRLVEPVQLGGVTVTATNGALAATAQEVIFATGPTYVPPEFGGGGEPSVNHPHGNTLFAHDWRGRPRWVWRLDNDLQGLAVDAAGHWLAVTQGAEQAQPPAAFQGVALLDLRAAAADRVVYRLPLEGRPVYGATAFSPDGRWLALAETPRRIAGQAQPRGANRLLLVR